MIPNQPPVAALTVTGGVLHADADGTGSSDPDGTIASYRWDWADGTTTTTSVPTTSHDYATAGTRTVVLTVTDAAGATATANQTVVVAPANQPPVASFTATVSSLSVAFDAAGSSDPDGSVTGYAWTFGDGATGTGAQVPHAYATPGVYTVGLTVTDNGTPGLTGSTTRQVTVTAPPPDAVVARDAFGRTVAGGWGDADLGGAWTATGTPASVDGSAGVLTLGAGAVASSRLPGVEASVATLRVSTVLDKRPNGSGGGTLVRGRITPAGEYRLKTTWAASGVVTAALVRTNGAGQDTVLVPTTATGVTYAAGTVVRTRFEVSGASPTTLRAKLWTGATEPTAWQLQTTDSAAGFQVAGHTGLAASTSSTVTNTPVTFRFDDYSVTGPDVPVVVANPLLVPLAGTPKNIIELIGDGMGFNQVDLGNLFEKGEQAYQATIQNGALVTPVPGQVATQSYQRFAVQTGMSTYPSGRSYDPTATWATFGQALRNPTDSSASGTALSTGVKTLNTLVGVDPVGTPVRTIAA